MLHQFSADWAPYSEVMVEALQALGAEGVSTVNEYPWYSFSDIELFCAIVAKVEAPGLVVGLDLLVIIEFLLLLI